MGIEVRTGEFEDAAAVRRAVFMDEQGYADEFDAIDGDAACVHVTLYADGELAACGRVFPEALSRRLAPGEPVVPACELDAGVPAHAVWLLGRVAVLSAFRRRGLGSRVVRACDEVAGQRGARLMKLHSQVYAQGLYAGCGYVPISAVDYEDEGQPHLWMAKAL